MKIKLLICAMLVGLLSGCVVERHGNYSYGLYPLGYHHYYQHHHHYYQHHHCCRHQYRHSHQQGYWW